MLWSLVSVVLSLMLNAIPSLPISTANSAAVKPVIIGIGCPNGYAKSPSGCVPRTCAFSSVVYFNEQNRTIVFDNGTRALLPQYCLGGSPIEQVTLLYPNGTVSYSTLTVPTTNGWVEDAHYSNCWWIFCSSLSSMSGTWPVPSNPSTYSFSTTIYLFIGMQDIAGGRIAQPVLQFGQSNGGGCSNGGSVWGIASYWVDGSTCIASTWKQVSVGDQIAGSLVETVCGQICRKWTITTKDNTKSLSTTLTVGPQQDTTDLANAYVTLEVYNVASCSYYPASGNTTFSNLVIGGGSPGWGTEIRQNDGCGEAVNIISSSQVKLVY
jgi:hypothetical protein